jgi:hypothetical protein
MDVRWLGYFSVVIAVVGGTMYRAGARGAVRAGDARTMCSSEDVCTFLQVYAWHLHITSTDKAKNKV